MPFEERGFALVGVSGGFSQERVPRFSPAQEVGSGTVTILLENTFVRADVNSDGGVDLSDAISILGHLFLGEGDPSCMDAADTNDDGQVDITDAVFLLGSIFLGEGRIPEPNPQCGVDPSEDELVCGSSRCDG